MGVRSNCGWAAAGPGSDACLASGSGVDFAWGWTFLLENVLFAGLVPEVATEHVSRLRHDC